MSLLARAVLAATALFAAQALAVAGISAVRRRGNVYATIVLVACATTPVVFVGGPSIVGRPLSIDGRLYLALMHLSLGYYKVATVSEVRGQATLVIEVEILFFSASVNLTVERRFGGTEADPTFADLIPRAALWDSYASAYA